MQILINKIVCPSLFSFLFLSCCISQKTIDNSLKIREFIVWKEWKTTSIRDENIIYPSYEVTLEKLTDKNIVFFHFKITWFYGQDYDYIKSKEFVWNKHSPELKRFNENGIYTIKEELYPIKRQNPNIPRTEGKEYGYLEPDGEEIQGYNYKLIVEW